MKVLEKKHILITVKINSIILMILGVFTGYNLLSVALTLPKDGKVIGCDINTDYIDIGRPFLEEVRRLIINIIHI